ncbi:hypothetical protein EI555_015547, partial [Monodon monoceros]
EGFGCVVTNRFDQLFDNKSDPFEVLKATENKKKEASGGGFGGPGAKSAAQAVAQTPTRVGVVDKKEEMQPPVALKKEGKRRVGRRPDQQLQGEEKIIDRRPERRPPRERRFEKPLEVKGGGLPWWRPLGRGRGGCGRGMGRGDGFDSRDKCEFDRHSEHEDKRGGSGSHSWGTVKDELTDLEQSNVTEETPEGEEHPVADTENKENEVEKSILESLAAQDVVAGEDEVAVGVVDVQTGASGLTSQVLLLLTWMTQRHSQLWLNWVP